MKRKLIAVVFGTFLIFIFCACSACSTSTLAMKELKFAICDHSFSNNAVLVSVKSNGQIDISQGEWLIIGDIDSKDFMEIESVETKQLSNRQIRKLNKIMNKIERFDGEFGGSVDRPFFVANIDGKEYCYSLGVEKDENFHAYIETLRRYCGILGIIG